MDNACICMVRIRVLCGSRYSRRIVMYVTAKEVARHVNITEKTAYKWAREGKIPCRRFGRTVKFSIEDIDGRKETTKVEA